MGGRVSARPSGKSISIPLYSGPFHYFFTMWKPFCYVFLPLGGLFHHVRAFFATFFFLWWAFFTMWGHFRYFLLYVVGLFYPYREPFWACQPSLRKFLRAPMPPPCGRPCSPHATPPPCGAPMQTHSICILHVSSINYTVGNFLNYV